MIEHNVNVCRKGYGRIESWIREPAPRPRTHELVLAVKSKDVVAHDILAAIVLVETGAPAAVHDVVFDHHVAGAFVPVDAPSSISE